MRPPRVPQLRLSGEHRANDLDLAEHRGGEDVDPRAVAEQELGDVAPSHVGGGPKARLPVAAAPVPGGIRDGGVRRESAADRLEVGVGIGDELADQSAVERGWCFGRRHG